MRMHRHSHLGLLVLVALLASCSAHKEAPRAPGASETSTTHVVVNPDQLPGIRTGPAPWPPELDHLRDRLGVINIPALTQEGAAMDMHVQLSVFVAGTQVVVPASIGLDGQEVSGGRMVTGFVSPLHTHDDTGLIHVHSPTVREYTIGDILDVWGVRFTDECLGGSCAAGDRVVRVFVNGKLIRQPRTAALRQQQRIVLTVGTESELPTPIPSKFGDA